MSYTMPRRGVNAVWERTHLWIPARYSMDGLESDDEAEAYGCFPFVLLILNQPLENTGYYENLRLAGTSPIAAEP